MTHHCVEMLRTDYSRKRRLCCIELELGSFATIVVAVTVTT